MLNSCKAISIGYRVKELVSNQADGKLYSVHDDAIYCLVGLNELFLIHKPQVGRLPYGISTNAETGYYKSIGIEIGMAMTISDQSLCVPGADFFMDLREAEVWYPIIRSGYFPRLKAEANVEYALQRVSIIGSRRGLGEFSIHMNDLFLHRREVGVHLNRLCQHCIDPLAQLLSGIQERSRSDVESSLRSMIGLGVGLTPSADDLIAGLITALWLLAERLPGGIEWISAVGEMIRTLSGARTTLVSQNNLRYVTSGDRFEVVDDLIQSILYSTRQDVEVKVDKLVSLGSTSGTEMTVGILLGMKLVLGTISGKTDS